tara:strand:+ start:47 stop:535 length:489 start_codon:yes stop_codon:yes gene_type:complete
MAIGMGLKALGLAGVATVGLELLALRNLMKEEKDKLSPEQKEKINKKIESLKKRLPDMKGKPFDEQAGKKTKKPKGKTETRFNKGGMAMMKKSGSMKMAGSMTKKKPSTYMAGGMAKKKSMGYEAGGMALKKPTGGAKKLPKAVRNKMGMMNKGGMAKKKAK